MQRVEFSSEGVKYSDTIPEEELSWIDIISISALKEFLMNGETDPHLSNSTGIPEVIESRGIKYFWYLQNKIIRLNLPPSVLYVDRTYYESIMTEYNLKKKDETYKKAQDDERNSIENI